MPTPRSKQSLRPVGDLCEGFSAPATSVPVKNQNTITSPDTRDISGAAEGMAVNQTSNLEGDEGHADPFDLPAWITNRMGTTAARPRAPILVKKPTTCRNRPAAKLSRKRTRSPKSPIGQSRLAGSNEQSQVPQHRQNCEELAVSSGRNAQPDSQASRTSDNVQCTQVEPNKDGNKEGSEADGSQGSSEEEQLREPVYYQQPRESPHDAQTRYINAFFEYNKKMDEYRLRNQGPSCPQA